MTSNEIIVTPSSPNTITVDETTNEIIVTAGGPKGEKGDPALGVQVLTEDSIGLGENSLSNGTPLRTVAVGVDTHQSNEETSDNTGKILENTVIGYQASKIHKGKRNTAIGVRALDTEENTNNETRNNIVIGYEAGRNLNEANNNNMIIGNEAKLLKKVNTSQDNEQIKINTDQNGNNQMLFDGNSIRLLRFSGFNDTLKTNAVEFDSKARLIVPSSIKEHVFNFKHYIETVMVDIFDANKLSDNNDPLIVPPEHTFNYPTDDRNYWVWATVASRYIRNTITVASENSPVGIGSKNDLSNESFFNNSSEVTQKTMITDDLWDKFDGDNIINLAVIDEAIVRLKASNGSLQTLDLKDTNFQNIYDRISSFPEGKTVDDYSTLSDQRFNNNYTFKTIEFEMEMEEGESLALALCNPYKPTTVIWDSSIKWVGNVEPNLATTETEFCNIEFWKQSGNIYGAFTGKFS